MFPARVLRFLNRVQSFFLRPDRPTPIAAPIRASVEITAVNPGKFSVNLSNPDAVSFPAEAFSSNSSSIASQSPSPSASDGMLVAFSGSEPHSFSLASVSPSPSSSVSALLPIPSSSVSIHSVISYGKASSTSGVLSPSSSVSELSPTPSPS